MKSKHPKHNTAAWLFTVAGGWGFLLSNILHNNTLAWLSIPCSLVAIVLHFRFLVTAWQKKNQTDPS